MQYIGWTFPTSVSSDVQVTRRKKKKPKMKLINKRSRRKPANKIVNRNKNPHEYGFTGTNIVTIRCEHDAAGKCMSYLCLYVE